MKIFASDFDGTLYFRDKGICRQDQMAIQAFQNAGGQFGVCTGRSLSGIRNAVQSQLHLDFYILSTGAQIIDSNGQTIFEKDMGKDIASELYDRYREETESIFHGREQVYHYGPASRYQTHIDALDDIGDDIVLGVSFAAESRAHARVLATDMNRRFGDRIHAFQNISFIDVVAAGCSKGAALRKLKEACRSEKTGGIGDSYNDVSLIEDADVGYTFPNSPAEVRSSADEIVESVGQALEHFMRIS